MICATIIISSVRYFPWGTGKRNTHLLPPMQTSATDTAAGGVGMMVWEEGAGVVYAK